MRVTVLGSGGREQAIAWACRRHGHDATVRPELGALTADDTDLVIVGPEALLVDGAADECGRRRIPCFGPTAELTQLEASKGFARDLATDLGIPGPTFARFELADEALAWWREVAIPVVVKVDGLAAGKGVVVPDTVEQTVDAIMAAARRGPFVLEERMVGPECSLLALCDGRTARALPLAQDHKRIGEGDTGPNTGGMGAYAPAPLDADVDELLATFVTPVIEHFASAGTPYVGVVYAGLMLTADGPKLVEYNCRFGDPETQAVLPLLDSDLAELASACTRGELADAEVAVATGATCTVVAAAPGYPGSASTGATIDLGVFADDDHADGAILFRAGTTFDTDTGEERVAGGRVLAVTGTGDDLAAARAVAYGALASVRFDGMQVRRDIAWRAPGAMLRTYAAAGVDIDEGGRAVDAMRDAVEATHGPAVVRGLGSFGGGFSAAELAAMDDPVLVASTDGVGTKVELAARLGRVRGIGHDIVNHCIDDVLVQAARPLFFLDYVAAGTLDAQLVAEVVTGMAEACSAAGCALLGGETAEMPGVYQPGAFDIAGTLVGVAERDALLPRDDLAEGDALVGLASSGPHTNGYSLLRSLFRWIPLESAPGGLDRPLGDALLEPHRSYLDVLGPVLAAGSLKALAHVTGGGLAENLPRVLPDRLDARVDLDSWPIPPLFRLVRELTPSMSTTELYRTLNMGIGMVLVVPIDRVDEVRGAIDEPTWMIGELVAGTGTVELRSDGRPVD